MNAVIGKIGEIGIVPVIKIEKAENAIPLVEALVAGGLPCAEFTFRSDAAAEAIARVAKAYPDFPVGAGTVINRELAERAVDSGARFIVAPGFNPSVVDWCLSRGIPVIPGVNNPSLVEQALERGLEVLKFFPAEASGGVAMLDALSGPFPKVSFVPTGGIDLANLAEYARRPNVHAIGGTWMVRPELVDGGNWGAVTDLAREASLAIQGFAFAHLGINGTSETKADDTSAFFANLGLAPKDGTSSIFNDTVIEVMKTPFRGTMGHIAFRCWNVERSLKYLETLGYRAVPETVKIEKGRVTVAYLDREVAGFAIHLVRAK
jgi:2-dehydro-3-deoxyphosphogluconate aldolase/(4S)-4-hydroxy-2-oxoglutarate aldolase